MEYFISSSHWLDASSPDLEGHLQYLCTTVDKILKREHSPVLLKSSYNPMKFRRLLNSLSISFKNGIILAIGILLTANLAILLGSLQLVNYRIYSLIGFRFWVFSTIICLLW